MLRIIPFLSISVHWLIIQNALQFSLSASLGVQKYGNCNISEYILQGKENNCALNKNVTIIKQKCTYTFSNTFTFVFPTIPNFLYLRAHFLLLSELNHFSDSQKYKKVLPHLLCHFPSSTPLTFSMYYFLLVNAILNVTALTLSHCSPLCMCWEGNSLYTQLS